MIITISASVGRNGQNSARDVKSIQALLNVYLRGSRKPPLAVDGNNSAALEDAIRNFQVEYVKLGGNADSRIDPNGPTLQQLKEVLANVFAPQDVPAPNFPAPNFGTVTWESEGAEGGRWHSRKLHVPSSASGLTLGRGYDCRRKTQARIGADMTSADLAANMGELLAKAAGLFGPTAEQFIIDNDLLDFQITPAQQLSLFEISYDHESAEVRRICKKRDVINLYGETDWDNLHQAIKEITIDLKFRGDYTGRTRRLIQKSIADNNLEDFKDSLLNRSHWLSVPADRFQRRVAFLN